MRPARGIGIWLLPLLMAGVSCRTAQHLAENEVLYTGAGLRFHNEQLLEDNKAIKAKLRDYLKPEPNDKLFGLRFKLWLYQHTREPKKEKGLRNWLKYKVGEPPVLMSDVNPSHVAGQLEAEMFNEGYFHTTVEFEVVSARKKAQVNYHVLTGARYHLDTVIYPRPDSSLFSRSLDSLRENSLLKEKNTPYSLSLLKEEKLRFEFGMKERGFYYFNEQQLYFRADTTVGDHRVLLKLVVTEDIPLKSRRRYSIGEVWFNPFYGTGDDLPQPADTTQTSSGVVFVGKDSLFRPEAMERYIYVKPGEIYSKGAHEQTLRQLSSLGVFDFVSMVFEESDSVSEVLDAYIQLTPSRRRTIGSNFNLVTKSNGFTGPNLELRWVNRNLFRGAEYYELRLDGGVEALLLTGREPLFSYELGVNNELRFPKMLSALKFPEKIREKTPFQTRFQLGYRLINRVNFYRMNTISAGYGYRWRSKEAIEHLLELQTLSYVQVGNTTDSFQQRLDDNPALKRSFEQQFIIGRGYTFTFNPPAGENEFIRLYFKGAIETSGTLFYLAYRAMGREEPTDEDPYTLFGLPFAQFVKTDLDFRSYLNISEQHMLAFRQFLGIGLPQGNSSSLPFIRQYFSGGASSIRAFRFRSIGPGTFRASQEGAYYYLDQTGDLKLETSLEYRFPIQKMLKGALFADAGNIWLVNDNPDKPGGKFEVWDFIGEIAIGAGAGLRLDLRFFVLRFDAAVPFKKPFLPTDRRWVISDIAFGNPAWRKENLLFNLAIGYPF